MFFLVNNARRSEMFVISSVANLAISFLIVTQIFMHGRSIVSFNESITNILSLSIQHTL